MPYIRPEDRDRLDPTPRTESALTAGELNYQITCLVNRYLAQTSLRYADINEVIGVLECAKLELYRRIAAPYEDDAIERNGDVYTCAPAR